MFPALNCHGFLGRTALGLAIVFACTTAALADSDILSLSGGFAVDYQANDYFAARGSIDTFDVFGDQVAIWGLDGLQILDRATGDVQEDLGLLPDSYLNALPLEIGIYSSFVTFDPSGNSVWAGFTTSGNVDDRIYQVTNQGGSWQWTHRATLVGNQEMVFFGGNAFASANPASPDPGAALFLVDVSMPGGLPSSTHDLIVTLGDYSTGLAVDGEGSLYGLTNDLLTGTLWKFDAAAVATAVGPSSLAMADGEKLSDLPYGGGDAEVDSAGNVLFTMNRWGVASQVAMWDGIGTGDGNHFELVAEGSGANGNFLAGLKSLGDFTTGDGMLYVNDGNWIPYDGLTALQHVPEPSTIMMVVVGALAALGWYRRRQA